MKNINLLKAAKILIDNSRLKKYQDTGSLARVPGLKRRGAGWGAVGKGPENISATFSET